MNLSTHVAVIHLCGPWELKRWILSSTADLWDILWCCAALLTNCCYQTSPSVSHSFSLCWQAKITLHDLHYTWRGSRVKSVCLFFSFFSWDFFCIQKQIWTQIFFPPFLLFLDTLPSMILPLLLSPDVVSSYFSSSWLLFNPPSAVCQSSHCVIFFFFFLLQLQPPVSDLHLVAHITHWCVPQGTCYLSSEVRSGSAFACCARWIIYVNYNIEKYSLSTTRDLSVYLYSIATYVKALQNPALVSCTSVTPGDRSAWSPIHLSQTVSPLSNTQTCSLFVQLSCV